tara:strand:- start:533 stop:1186 length:654 start_codon:yes stop_codon:yes gene_type:complete
MNIQKNLDTLKNSIPKEITLIAVSKTKSIKEILLAYNHGHKIFGENKIQEMTSKWETLPKDIEWHMIGHVQRNKVKYMAPYVSMIHGVDSLKLLKEINKQGKNNNRCINCLIQIRIADESSKFGMNRSELEELYENLKYNQYKYVKICGLMGMATNTVDGFKIYKEFEHLKSLYNEFKNKFSSFNYLSMGMSADYKIAIDLGSNMIRVGSKIFGVRN